MAMSPFQILGELGIFSEGYDVVIDQTQTGYFIFGLAKSIGGTKTATSAALWAICRCKVTETNKLNWFRWADGKGLKFNQVWNSNGLDDVYNGTATF